MSIEAIKAITSTTATLDQSKDPPWGSKDLSKLRLLMNQGYTVSEMARELGTTINDVSQMVSQLTLPSANKNPSGSGQAVTDPSVGTHLDIKT